MKNVDNISTFLGTRVLSVGKEMAMSNGCAFHLAAFLKRGKTLIRVGINQDIQHPRFFRFANGNHLAFLHAEMDALIAARPGDTLVVTRWQKNGRVTMSRPCRHCQAFIKEAGISRVIYSDWDGNYIQERFS